MRGSGTAVVSATSITDDLPPEQQSQFSLRALFCMMGLAMVILAYAGPRIRAWPDGVQTMAARWFGTVAAGGFLLVFLRFWQTARRRRQGGRLVYALGQPEAKVAMAAARWASLVGFVVAGVMFFGLDRAIASKQLMPASQALSGLILVCAALGTSVTLWVFSYTAYELREHGLLFDLRLMPWKELQYSWNADGSVVRFRWRELLAFECPIEPPQRPRIRQFLETAFAAAGETQEPPRG